MAVRKTEASHAGLTSASYALLDMINEENFENMLTDRRVFVTGGAGFVVPMRGADDVTKAGQSWQPGGSSFCNSPTASAVQSSSVLHRWRVSCFCVPFFCYLLPTLPRYREEARTPCAMGCLKPAHILDKSQAARFG
jgi:hypothetical protein